MPKLFEYSRLIDDALASGVDHITGEFIVDEETGEPVVDFAMLESLQMEQEEKVHQCCLYYMNRNAEIEAMKNAERNIAKRRKVAEKANERLLEYIAKYGGGVERSFPECRLHYKKSSAIETDEKFIDWAKRRCKALIRISYEPDKTAIKAMLKNGENVPHAQIVERKTLKID